jgi:EAL domain-containing protein (putative c-di-GMP-specific phosphodiesterase class I)/FixJ family two-component response regulator
VRTADEHEEARILVVDDEEQNLSLISAMLGAAGYRQVVTVSRSTEALARFLDHRPDLILLDLHMPPPDGFTVMHEVREHVDPDDFLPILVLSADPTQQARERALANGASDFVPKPLQLAEVLLRIRNLLETRRMHQQLRDSHATMTAELAYRYRAEQAEAARLAEITERVTAVLSAGGPTMVYQPIIELLVGNEAGGARLVLDADDPPGRNGFPVPVGVEALARFNMQPSQGPNRWFEDAAQVKLALDLELSAVAAALEVVDQLPGSMFVSVNASCTTIVSARFHEMLGDIDGAKIVVELTEHERVDDYEELARSVARLHERGTRLAVDDAGAGFASLDHILRLGPDIVKLDRNLVMGVDHDPIRRSMIAAFVHFGNETGIALIAEGIECVDELDTLRRLGVRHAQGFHLALPSDLSTALAY